MKTSILLVLLPFLSAALALPTSMSDGVGASSNLASHVVTTRDTHYSNRKRATEGDGKSKPSEAPTGGSEATEQKKTGSMTPATSAGTNGKASKAALKSYCLKVKAKGDKYRIYFFIHGEDHEKQAATLEESLKKAEEKLKTTKEESKTTNGKLKTRNEELFKFEVKTNEATGDKSSWAKSASILDETVANELMKIFEKQFNAKITKLS